MEWLNGPLVWAIEEARQALYHFPRDCPRILLWPTPRTTPQDMARWFPPGSPRIIAHVERAWSDRIAQASIHRYSMPTGTFEDLGDAGMWVSRVAVDPMAMETLTDLPGRLGELGVELRWMDDLTPLRGVWDTSLHASGVRLRNAQGW